MILLNILAIKGLWQFQRFKAISDFRKLLDSWYIDNFQIPDVKKSQEIDVSERLSTTGDNLALVAEFLFENHSRVFDEILEKMKLRVHGFEKVEAVKTEYGRIILKFQDGSFIDTFISRYVSDSTLKMFAFLVLVNNYCMHPLLYVELENYLYPGLFSELTEEFRNYIKKGRQVFLFPYLPEFVNTLELDELFWITKKHGCSIINHAKKDETIKEFYKAGDKLGYIWTQKYIKRM